MWTFFKRYYYAPMLKYGQKLFNRCCFSSLDSAFAAIEQTKVYNAIAFRIEESLKSKMVHHIVFESAVLKNEKILK